MSIQRAHDMKLIKKKLDSLYLKQGLAANKLFKSRGRNDQQ